MSEESFDHKRVMYEIDETETYKNINLKNDTSMCFEDDVVIKGVSIHNFAKTFSTSPQHEQQLIPLDSNIY